MREAIIIKNPKWQAFSKVIADFKSLSSDAVLVERGSCKEKKPAKPAKASSKSE